MSRRNVTAREYAALWRGLCTDGAVATVSSLYLHTAERWTPTGRLYGRDALRTTLVSLPGGAVEHESSAEADAGAMGRALAWRGLCRSAGAAARWRLALALASDGRIHREWLIDDEDDAGDAALADAALGSARAQPWLGLFDAPVGEPALGRGQRDPTLVLAEGLTPHATAALQALHALWTLGDGTTLQSLTDDDAEWHGPAGARARGATAAATITSPLVAATDARSWQVAQACDGLDPRGTGVLALAWRYTGTQRAPLVGVPAASLRVRVDGQSHLQLERGRIVHGVTLWSRAAIARHLAQQATARELALREPSLRA